jgi:hypothetical protein
VSESILRIIPDDPAFVPSKDCERKAMKILAALVPGGEVTAKHSAQPQFVDPGENFERVLCPYCRADLKESWPAAMDRAWSTKFSDLAFEAPCCGGSTNLNELVYEWPAGFARYVLEVSGINADSFLPESQAESIAQSLGCRVRQILSRY